MSALTRSAHRRRVGAFAGTVAALGVAVALFAPGSAPTSAAAAPAEGIVCTNPTSGPGGSASFALTAKSGVINMPDGNSMMMWSLAGPSGTFQYPGPVLCVNEGQKVNITLRNQLSVRTSLQFPGQYAVKANGNAAQPQFGANGQLLALTSDVAPGGSITYSFDAAKPGTYLYQSGNDTRLQVEMGLVGVIVVRPTSVAADQAGLPPGEVAALAYNDQSTRYTPEHEYLVMLTELDPELHYAVEGGITNSAQYMAPYRPRYFMINGRSFPDVIAPNGAAWLPSQPYGGLAHVEPYDAVKNPLPALIRYVALGAEPYPFHPHSNHERIIAKDGRPLKGDIDQSRESFAITVDPGTTIDATFTWTNVEDYGSGKPVPVPPPNGANQKEGDWYSGSPYLGNSGVLNPGVQAQNQCGEYYHVAHNHNLPEATNYGAAFGGQLTLIRVDPAGGTGCGNG